MAAVPGSDIGGPLCAPNQASAALSRSLANQRSSRASPEPRKSTARSAPEVRGLPVPRGAQRPERPDQPRRAGCPPERGDDGPAARPPDGDEPAVGGGVLGAAGGLDRGAGRVEVDREDQRPAVGTGVAGAGRRGEAPGVAVDVGEPVRGEVELLDDAAVPDDHVRARTPVDADAGPALDRRHRAAEHVVGLDHLDRQAGPRQVAGGDQTVVAGTDDDDVGGRRLRAGRAPGRRGSIAPRMAKGRASPGKW